MNQDEPLAPPAPAAAGSFPTTQWSLVLNAGAGSESRARVALEMLCRRYWYPLYAFARRQGRTHHEAEDCTQEFLARLLAGDAIARAQPERGRFRTFLLTALRNFLSNEWHRARAEKRGGRATVISLEGQNAEQRFALEPSDPALTPESAFDWNWARGLIDSALAELRDEYEKRGQRAVFAELATLLWGQAPGETLAGPAARAGLAPHAFAVALDRLRKRLAERLRSAVAETVPGQDDVDAELRYLIEVVSRTPAHE
jgi:RNA polymerase sigma-70 factor (ECF subfamily)